MRIFFKYFGMALVVQVLLVVAGVTVGSVSSSVDALFERYLKLYEPFIVLILRSGNYRGEAAMIDPVIKGVPLGIFLYSVLVGALAFAITKLKAR
jgi:hypothetical protein